MFILGNKGMHMTKDILLKEETEKIILKVYTTEIFFTVLVASKCVIHGFSF